MADQIDGIYKIDEETGKLSLGFHAGQSQAWSSEKRFIFVIAGHQSGKTSFGPWWLHREIQRRGPGDYLAVTANYDLFKLKMLPEMMVVFEDILKWGEYRAGEKIIVPKKQTSPPTRIILRSAAAQGGLESATAKAAWLDECGQDDFALDAWEAIQRRLSLYQGRVLGTTTPYNLGWLKVEVFDRFRHGDPDYDVVQFRSIENPMFSVDEYERAKATLPAWKFSMFYDGAFARPAALIYGTYNDGFAVDGGHVVESFSIPKEWPRYVGIDFGPINTCVLWAAENPWGDIFVYREDHGGDLSSREHAQKAIAYREPVVLWSGGAPAEEEMRLEWYTYGVPVTAPMISEVEAGIARVESLFKTRRLFVMEHCRGLRAELGSYSRELDAGGEPTFRIQDKKKFHHLDALRYLASAFSAERPNEEEESDEDKPLTRSREDIVKMAAISKNPAAKVGPEEYS